MKKRILASLLALCMFIAVAPISALAADPVTTEEELLAAVENGGEITLGASLTQSIVIPAGKTVILNLNGKTLTNNGSTDTITVEQGASLTVTGSGIVKNTADGRGAVFNNGHGRAQRRQIRTHRRMVRAFESWFNDHWRRRAGRFRKHVFQHD